MHVVTKDVPAWTQAMVAKELGVSLDQVGLDTRFIDDLGADSLHLAQIEIAVEDAWDVFVGKDTNCRTVSDIVKFIEAQIKEGEGSLSG